MTVAKPPLEVLPRYRAEFDRLCQLEPRLGALLDRARSLYEEANLTTSPRPWLRLDRFVDREWYGTARHFHAGRLPASTMHMMRREEAA